MELRRLLLILALLGACKASTKGGAVATPEPLAAQEAQRILRAGGNAVDAAVAVGFVLAVTHPYAGNLGGGGFIVAHIDGEDIVLDCRETAPGAATADMYLDGEGEPVRAASLVGPLAAGVPGSVDGYLRLLERYGTMSRKQVLAPAIRLAREGFRVDPGLYRSLVAHEKLLARFPETAAIFLPGGKPPEIGEVLRQPQLAEVLEEIAKVGRGGFHQGWFADEVAKANKKYGGRITAEGHGPLPVRLARSRSGGRYGGLDVVTMPPPSSGGVVLLQILGMLERGGYASLEPGPRLHLFVEASRRAFADRAVHFGDPDHVDVPVEALLAKEYLDKRFATISMVKASRSVDVFAGTFDGGESTETCHFSVVDGKGNAVSCTTTLNGAYGCGLAIHGVLFNNEMDDFTAKPGVPNQFGLIQGKKNAIAPHKRPLSSMTPTIVLRDGEPFLVVGSPGGPTIISSVCQVIAHHVGEKMPLPASVAAPRVHHQWQPDHILAELLPAEITRYLRDLGHELKTHTRPIGDVQAVGRDKYGRGVPVSDPRGRGAVALPR